MGTGAPNVQALNAPGAALPTAGIPAGQPGGTPIPQPAGAISPPNLPRGMPPGQFASGPMPSGPGFMATPPGAQPGLQKAGAAGTPFGFGQGFGTNNPYAAFFNNTGSGQTSNRVADLMAEIMNSTPTSSLPKAASYPQIQPQNIVGAT